ncbi:MAG: T9SS type A sorting domain-containing protein [Bacteroidales bacterium]|nr:T9SS type A sorting domain-containing protein [Bacteroidales bacterium]
MKKLYLLFTIVLFVKEAVIFSQPYESIFGKDTTVWFQAREAIDRIDNIQLSTVGDTVINDLDYKKIFGDDHIQYLNLYLREDTLTGKVWIRDNESELLIMDLSLQKEDTFKIITNQLDSNAIVDTVYFINDKKIIELDYILYLDDKMENLKFIEGVGSNAGLIYQLRSLDDNFENAQFLLCLYKDGILVYSDDLFNNECYYNNTYIESNPILNELKVFPNPFLNQLTVRIPLASLSIISIFDTLGRTVYQAHTSKVGETELNLSYLASGVYLLYLENNNVSYISKIIKQ